MSSGFISARKLNRSSPPLVNVKENMDENKVEEESLKDEDGLDLDRINSTSTDYRKEPATETKRFVFRKF